VATLKAVTRTEQTVSAEDKAKVEELRHKHPSYVNRVSEWVFFANSYDGGRRYLEGGYLYRHPNEPDDAYKHRLAVACYYNFCQEVVDIYVSYLFRSAAEIDYGNLAKDDLFKQFLEDSDLKGNSLKSFMRESQRKASVYGHIAVVVDKPRVPEGAPVETRQDEKDLNIRPYVYRVLPTELVDWKYERTGTGGYKLTMAKIQEAFPTSSDDIEQYRIWYPDRWEVWRIVKDAPEMIDGDENPLGEIPLVFLRNLAAEEDLVGRSDLNDIAYVNRHIYNLCSWNDENIENTCFAMLAKAKREAGEGGRPDDDAVGPSIIMEYDPSEPNDKPYWLEPPGVSQEVFDRRLDRDVQEIHRMAKHGGIATTAEAATGQPKSGVALEIEFRMMNSTLSEKADNIEEAHQRICELWARWQEMEGFDSRIDYPDDFNVEDLAEDLENAINAVALRVSPRFNTEMKKRLTRVALPKMDPKTAREIEEQIEAQTAFFIPAEIGSLMGSNLVNAIDVVMALRGVDEEQAKRILEKNAEINSQYKLNIGPAPPDLSRFTGGEGEEE